MVFDVKNQTITIGVYCYPIPNNSDLEIFVHEAQFSSITPLQRLPYHVQWAILAIISVLTLTGTYFRFVSYRDQFERYKLKETTSIDSLILVMTIIQHLTSLMMCLNGFVEVVHGVPLEDSDVTARYIIRWLMPFETFYSAIGRLGLSIFRILYIRYHFLVKYTIGEKIISRTILVIGFLMSILMVTYLGDTEFQQYYLNGYLKIYTDDNVRQILDTYERSKGNISPYHIWQTTNINVSYFLLVVSILDIIIYILFFYHIYQHDNSQGLSLLLEAKVIRKRNKRNAITFFGQFCLFILELSFAVLVILSITLTTYKIFGGVVFQKIISLACMPIIEVLISPSLRKRTFA